MNITDYFNQHFEVVPADTDDLFEEVLKLRYQVYCVENPLAERKNFVDCKEQDTYDSRSVHRLIRHKLTGIFVASVRLILPSSVGTIDPFPMETFCGQCFYKDLEYPRNFSRQSLAEVSRFLVSKKREQQIKEAYTLNQKNSDPDTTYKRQDGLRCYLLLFGLLSAVMQITYEHKILFWYIGIQAPLFRLLKRFSIRFIQLGPVFEYHGKRTPCLGSARSISHLVHKYRPDLWNFATQGGKLTHFNEQNTPPGNASPLEQTKIPIL